jgi:hypothetical protein
VQEVANAIEMNKHLLEDKDRRLIIQEIGEAIMHGYAGMDCDVAVWKELKKKLEAEDEPSTKKTELTEFHDPWNCLACRNGKKLCRLHKKMARDGSKPPNDIENWI